MNFTWLVYAIKVDNPDILGINSFGTFIAFVYVFLYIFIKRQV